MADNFIVDLAGGVSKEHVAIVHHKDGRTFAIDLNSVSSFN